MATRAKHWEGSPDCAEDCAGPHLDDDGPAYAESCPSCGGNGRACRYGCIDRGGRRYDEFEGHTGGEYVEDDYPF